jgi:hypothetical protein
MREDTSNGAVNIQSEGSCRHPAEVWAYLLVSILQEQSQFSQSLKTFAAFPDSVTIRPPLTTEPCTLLHPRHV